MHFPHERREPRMYGRSPGNGTTAALLSREPLASESEATPGPDDYNPYEDPRRVFDGHTADATPTGGSDPFVFDDVGTVVADVALPSPLGDGPRF